MPLIELLDNGVALASTLCEPGGIEDRDAAAGIGDEAFALEITSRHGDADAADAEHAGEKFMRKLQLIRLRAVARHQEPARGACLYRMKRVAGGGLSKLPHE